MKINTIPKTFHLIHKTKINGRTFAVLSDENEQRAFTVNELQEMFYGDSELDGLIQGDGFFLRLPDVGDLLMVSKHGVLSGWGLYFPYWSATPYGCGHATVRLVAGDVNATPDDTNRYVAFEVIQ